MSRFLFPRWSNALLPFVLVVGAVAPLYMTLLVAYGFSPKTLDGQYQPVQPVPYSHALHAGKLGLDCRYCHSFVEVASHSNVPTTQTCMSCHTQIKADSPKLTAVRDSWKTGEPVNWVRIHQVPDYTYFNHAVHVNRGVSCYSCHGAINEMKVVYQHEPQSMSWCLDCHRAPENHLRPPSEIYNMAWKPPVDTTQREIGLKFKEEWEVNPPVTCGGCHR